MYAYELANQQQEFLLLHAQQTVGQFQALMQALPGGAPLTLIMAGDGLYYLFDAAMLEVDLYRQREDQTLWDALGLQARSPVPVYEASDPLNPDLTELIITENGRVSGIYSPLGHSKGIFLNGDQPERSYTSWEGREETSYLQSEAPEALITGEEAPLLLWITWRPSDRSGALSLGAGPGEALDVRVRAISGLEITGPAHGRLIVPPGGQKSSILRVDLRAIQAGVGRLQIFCVHNGVSLGSLTLSVPVFANESEARQAAASAARQEQSAGLAVTNRTAPNLTLWVEETRVNGAPAVHYQLIEAGANGVVEEYEPVPLQQSAEPYFARYLAEIEEMLLATHPAQVDEARTDLELRGEGLFDQLFPEALAHTLWQRREQIESIHILSQESWIPWEMVRLFGLENGRLESGKFFGEYRLSRWNPEFAHQPDLRLKQVAVIAPADPPGEDMRDEVSYLCQLSTHCTGLRVSKIPARLGAVVRTLDQGEYNGLHFTGHALHHPADALSSAIQLENGRLLFADQLSGRLKNCGQAHPLVFFNACQTAPGSPGLSGLNGWAQQFMAIGASAFIGTHWSVDGPSASQFARAFYESLMQGDAVTEAARQARTAIRDNPSLSWLAYTVFCDPTLRVV